MEFRLLGPLTVLGAEGPLTIGGARERALLSRLLLDPGRPVRVGVLVEELWPGGADGAARSLQVRVSSLRRQLGDEAPIVRAGGGYAIEVAPNTVDLHRFERLVSDAERAAPEAVLALTDQALALWTGPPLTELGDSPTAVQAVDRVEGLHARARLLRARALLDLGRPTEAEAFPLLEEVRPDLEAALRHLLEVGEVARARVVVLHLWRWWYGTGDWRVCRHWLELLAGDEEPREDASRALAALAALQTWTGTPEIARETAGRALRLARAARSDLAMAEAISAVAAADSGRRPAAELEAEHLEAHRLLAALGRGPDAADVLLRASYEALLAGHPERSEAQCRQALAALGREAGHHQAATAHNNLGYLAAIRGDGAAASAHARRALDIHERVGAGSMRWHTLDTLAWGLRLEGDLDAAAAAAEEVVTAAQRAGAQRELPNYQLHLAAIQLDRDAIGPAAALLAVWPRAATRRTRTASGGCCRRSRGSRAAGRRGAGGVAARRRRHRGGPTAAAGPRGDRRVPRRRPARAGVVRRAGRVARGRAGRRHRRHRRGGGDRGGRLTAPGGRGRSASRPGTVRGRCVSGEGRPARCGCRRGAASRPSGGAPCPAWSTTPRSRAARPSPRCC